jgi:uncharacterized protein
MSTPHPDPHGGYVVRSFQPAFWLSGPHLQTLAGKFLRPRMQLDLTRERWTTPDGDFLDLDFTPETVGPREPGPLVLILHGLEGSTRRPYVRLAMRELASRGIRAVGLNFRSCSGEPNRAPTFYHSGDTGDVAWVLEELAQRFPGRPLGAVGFSLGGNVLLKLLAEDPGPLQAAVAISPPFDLAEGTRQLERTRMGRLYARRFLRSLLEKVETKSRLLSTRVDLAKLRKVRSLREFDDAATAPLHGFTDAWDYYRQSSCGPLLPEIRTPTLVLHARDDPFLPEPAIPAAALNGNPWLRSSLPQHGGHVGFIERDGPGAIRFWSESEAARYLARTLDVQGRRSLRFPKGVRCFPDMSQPSTNPPATNQAARNQPARNQAARKQAVGDPVADT